MVADRENAIDGAFADHECCAGVEATWVGVGGVGGDEDRGRVGIVSIAAGHITENGGGVDGYGLRKRDNRRSRGIDSLDRDLTSARRRGRGVEVSDVVNHGLDCGLSRRRVERDRHRCTDTADDRCDGRSAVSDGSPRETDLPGGSPLVTNGDSAISRANADIQYRVRVELARIGVGCGGIDNDRGSVRVVSDAGGESGNDWRTVDPE